MLAEIEIGQVILRPAVMSDCRRLYDWRLEPDDMSLSPPPANIMEHQAWLQRVLADPNSALFIAEAHGEAVGTGRLVIDGKAADISMSVASEHAGKGYSELILDLLVAEARKRGVRRLTSRVRNRNAPILGAFVRSQFVPVLDIVRLERNL